jgi:hypothetical protein
MGPIENENDAVWHLIGWNEKATSVDKVCWQGDATEKPTTKEDGGSREEGGGGGRVHVANKAGGGVNHARCESATRARRTKIPACEQGHKFEMRPNWMSNGDSDPNWICLRTGSSDPA